MGNMEYDKTTNMSIFLVFYSIGKAHTIVFSTPPPNSGQKPLSVLALRLQHVFRTRMFLCCYPLHYVSCIQGIHTEEIGIGGRSGVEDNYLCTKDKCSTVRNRVRIQYKKNNTRTAALGGEESCQLLQEQIGTIV